MLMTHDIQVVSSRPKAAQLWLGAPLGRPSVSVHRAGRWGPLRGWGYLIDNCFGEGWPKMAQLWLGASEGLGVPQRAARCICIKTYPWKA